MAKYLVSTTEVYRVDSESEAQALIDAAKEDTLGTLVKYSNTTKVQKSKGEIVDQWQHVILTRNFCDEKEPDSDVDIIYTDKEHTFEPDRNEN